MLRTRVKAHVITSGLAVGTSAALVAFGAAPAPAAQPQQAGEVSNALARALTVDLAGQDLPLDVLTPAIAENSGGDAITNVLPLDLSALEALAPDLGTGSLLGEGGFLSLGALNQFAEATGDGASSAAAGAVSDAGAIEIPETPAPDLSGASLVIGTETVGLGDLVELRVDLGAIASTAALPVGGVPSGTFALEDLGIGLGGSIIGDVAGQIDTAISPVVDQLQLLGGLLGVDGIEVQNPLAGGELAVSEQDVLDVAGVGSLSELEPGTDLLGYLPDAVVSALRGVVDDLVAQIGDIVTKLKESPLLGTICSPPLLPPNPACGVLDTAVGTVTDTLGTVIDTVVETVLATLGDTLSQLLALPVGTEVLGDDGSFALTALSAIVGPGGELGQLDLATSSVGPNTIP